ncbi:hypothetical protein IQ273_12140 [Nodosilinea sp. LEGE 07298]|nr:hypothetical protein [Nodosilinea sp. LEGE 07298]MBE9110161.1 hypothetical protein [Nodosilinea sp. LEGE 07298]
MSQSSEAKPRWPLWLLGGLLLLLLVLAGLYWIDPSLLNRLTLAAATAL